MSMLKQDYKENEMDLNAGLQLSVKILSKTLDTNKLTAEKGRQHFTNTTTIYLF